MAAVTDLKETSRTRKEKTTETKENRLETSVEYERVFVVVYDSPASPEMARVASFGNKRIPRINEAYPQNVTGPATVARDFDCKAIKDDHSKWEVTVGYVQPNPAIPEGNDAGTPPPADLPPEPQFFFPRTSVQWSFVKRNVPETNDVNGKPIANSAGQLFDPSLEEELADLQATIVNYSKTFDQLAVSGYVKKRTINSDPFLGFAAGECYLSNVEAEPQEHEHQDGSFLDYWKITYTIICRGGGWFSEALDHGSQQLVTPLTQQIAGASESPFTADGSGPGPGSPGFGGGTDGNAGVGKATKQITDKAGHPLRDALLDGKGGVLANGAKPVFIKFATYTPKPFGVLKIITTRVSLPA